MNVEPHRETVENPPEQFSSGRVCHNPFQQGPRYHCSAALSCY